MTAKEKAVELISVFNHTTYGKWAIDCAIIYVEGMIKELVLLQKNEFHDAWVVNRVNIWNEVKMELNKL